ncbi:MAG: HAD family hydrolase [Sedimenticola sp.]
MNNSLFTQDIRAISFDLDDTLWDNRPVLKAAEQALCDWLAEHYPRIGEAYDCEALYRLRHALYASRPDLHHDMTELRKVFLAQLALDTGYDRSLVEPAFEMFIEARHRITLYDDVIPGLERLRRDGYLLGALTNGNASIERLGIDHLFDFSVTSEEAGAAKPEPRMFEMACERSGIGPEGMLHVGDEPTTDIEGARRAGIRCIWMNRQNTRLETAVEPDAMVQDMQELLSLLQS